MSGEVRPGDANMAAGGASAGANQDNMIVVDYIRPLTKDRKYVIQREPQLEYSVYKDGFFDTTDLSCRNIKKNICIKDFDEGGIFKRPKEVSVLALYPHIIPIIVPVTLHMKDYDEVKGTIFVDFKCNPACPEKLVSMLGGDYAQECQKGVESHKYLTANRLCDMLRNDISNAAMSPVSKFETSFDVSEVLRSYLFDSLDRDMVFSERGLIIVRAFARFEASSMEKLMKLRLEGRIRMEENRIRNEENLLDIELAGREYDAINGA